MSTIAETMNNLSSNNEFMETLTGTSIEKCEFKITPELIERITNFLQKYIDTDRLVEGKHTKLWTAESVQNLTKTVYKILDPASHSKVHTLSDFFYQVSVHLMMDTCGGFEIERAKQSNIFSSGISFLQENKLRFLENQIRTQLAGQKNSFLCAVEWDYGEIGGLLQSGIHMIVLDTEIHHGNSGKAFFYTEDIGANEISYTEICDMLKQKYGEEILETYQKYQDKFALIKVQDFYVLLVHLKSIGSSKDISKNRELYQFMYQVRDMLMDYHVVMMGDFNLPLPSEENGHLNYTPKDLVDYPLRDEETTLSWMWKSLKSWFVTDTDDYLNKGFIRAIYDPVSVRGKARSDKPFYNSQAFKGKFYENRDYNTDQWFANFATPTEAQLFPDVPKIPYIGKEAIGSDSWLSDHQMLMVEFMCGDTYYTSFMFNVLSNCCSDKPSLRGNLLRYEVEAAEIEYSLLLSRVYEAITIH